MEDTTNRFGRYHSAIETQHVFLKDSQVFLKRDNQSQTNEIYTVEEWYPINFQWIPVLELQRNLIHQSNFKSNLK